MYRPVCLSHKSLIAYILFEADYFMIDTDQWVSELFDGGNAIKAIVRTAATYLGSYTKAIAMYTPSASITTICLYNKTRNYTLVYIACYITWNYVLSLTGEIILLLGLLMWKW